MCDTGVELDDRVGLGAKGGAAGVQGFANSEASTEKGTGAEAEDGRAVTDKGRIRAADEGDRVTDFVERDFPGDILWF